MGGFMSAIFGGQDTTLNGLIDQYGKIGQQQSGQGQKNQNQAGDFYSSIISGDSSKVSQALAPEISAAKTSAGQSNKTNSVFGTRSGGTAASSSATNDKVHSDITDLIGKLTGSSASSLANLGTSQVNTGLNALTQQQNADTQRYQNWSNSIFGKGMTSAAAAGESYALGGGA